MVGVAGRVPDSDARGGSRVRTAISSSTQRHDLSALFGPARRPRPARRERSCRAPSPRDRPRTTSRCTQRRAPDGSTWRHNPLPSALRPDSAAVRQKAAESALSGWRPLHLVVRGFFGRASWHLRRPFWYRGVVHPVPICFLNAAKVPGRISMVKSACPTLVGDFAGDFAGSTETRPEGKSQQSPSGLPFGGA